MCAGCDHLVRPPPPHTDKPIRSQVLASSRTLSAEAFNKVYGEIHTRCFALVNSPDLQDKLAGITAIGPSQIVLPELRTLLTSWEYNRQAGRRPWK